MSGFVAIFRIALQNCCVRNMTRSAAIIRSGVLVTSRCTGANHSSKMSPRPLPPLLTLTLEEKGFVASASIRDWKHLSGFGARAEETTPDGRLPVTSERYASFLVQFAAERRRILWSIPRSAKAAAWQKKKEQHAMSRLLRARGF